MRIYTNLKGIESGTMHKNLTLNLQQICKTAV
jgi:hypothetical protein